MSQIVTDHVPAALRAAAVTVKRSLEEFLAAADLPDNLRDAVAYAALDGGKRLRPALALLSCEAVGGSGDHALSSAMALEFIHCFSLAHDDLPAMDDDDLRRGRPTLHIEAGEAMAILAGDVMLALAFEAIGADPALNGRDADRGRLLRELSVATTAMIAGQVYDTLGGFPDTLGDAQRLHLTHRKKTGALLRAACRMGGIAGGATRPGLEALTSFGEAVGLMFQIVDDLLDVTQSAEHIGKATGKDQLAGKLTFPGLHGIEPSREEICRLRETAHQALLPLGPAAEPLESICEYLAVRTR